MQHTVQRDGANNITKGAKVVTKGEKVEKDHPHGRIMAKQVT